MNKPRHRATRILGAWAIRCDRRGRQGKLSLWIRGEDRLLLWFSNFEEADLARYKMQAADDTYVRDLAGPSKLVKSDRFSVVHVNVVVTEDKRP